jgi:hypothetical protein
MSDVAESAESAIHAPMVADRFFNADQIHSHSGTLCKFLDKASPNLALGSIVHDEDMDIVVLQDVEHLKEGAPREAFLFLVNPKKHSDFHVTAQMKWIFRQLAEDLIIG